MADIAVGMAINRHFGGKRKITTVEMKINYFRPSAKAASSRDHTCTSGIHPGRRER